MLYKLKKISLSSVVLFLSLLSAITPSCGAVGKRPIILGIGGGYSFFLDSYLRSYEVYQPKLIYFSEQLSLKYNSNVSLQYFPWRGFGFQVEFDQQKGSYSSDLKWYGYPTDLPDNPIVEINHIEDPYRENWSLSSFALSIIYALNFESQVKIRPFVSAGFGFHILNGNQERFRNRSRLGAKKSGRLIKLGLGIKYRLAPKIGINLRGFGTTMWRKEYDFRYNLEFGPRQFYYEEYALEGKIIRQDRYLVNSFTYVNIALSLEYTF
jgi:hypothetical protein